MNRRIEDTKDDFSMCIHRNDTFKLFMKIIAVNFSSNHEHHCMNIEQIGMIAHYANEAINIFRNIYLVFLSVYCTVHSY